MHNAYICYNIYIDIKSAKTNIRVVQNHIWLEEVTVVDLVVKKE